MSKVIDLKEYLVGDNSFLLDDCHNGKTIMLSGTWGVGKTYFWKNEIEPSIVSSLRDSQKACVYVSLYGKNDLEAIKNEIFYKAYSFLNSENEEDILTEKAISVLGFGSKLLSTVSVFGAKLDTTSLTDVAKSQFEGKKIVEAEKAIVNGGLICLDDFERKSRSIDLNDLFGFISQLSIEMNCKIVIILNSDVFDGKEKMYFD